VALNAGTDTFLLANVAGELPPGRWNGLYRVNRLQEDSVGKSDFRYPQGTYNVCPSASVGLLKGAALIGTQDAFYRSGRALQAAPTQPLALRYVRDTVTILLIHLI
jgi:hypothetical protein